MPCIFCLFLILLLSSPAHCKTIYVATTGDDHWSGTIPHQNSSRTNGPLLTLQGARDHLRIIRKAGLKGAIWVVIESGTYPVDGPLLLNSEDSGTSSAPTVYTAAPGAKPVIFGGRIIGGWKPGPDGVWQTRVPAVASGQWYFEQLWINGRRAVRARNPNTLYDYMLKVAEQPAAHGYFQQTITLLDHDKSMLNGLAGSNLADTQIVALEKWNCVRRIIKSVDSEAGTITVIGQKMDPLCKMEQTTPFYIENYKAALDSPGEWYLSRSGTLFYRPRPGENMRSATVVAPVVDQFIVIKGDPDKGRFVSNIVFKGLTFQYSQWLTHWPGNGLDQAASSVPAVIQADGARQILLQNCQFSHCGMYGVWFRKGCSHNTVQHCEFSDLGAGGIRIGDTAAPATPPDQTGFNWADNNIVYDCGKTFTDAVGIWIGDSGNNQITHNDIGELGYTGISAGWSWGYGQSAATDNTIAYNCVHNIGTRYLSDLGGIYTLGRSDGSVISHNVVHDVVARDFLGNGIYNDEGSSGILVKNNLVYNCSSAGYFLHYGRDDIVENNIFADNAAAQLDRKKSEPDAVLTVAHNICDSNVGFIVVGRWYEPHVTIDDNLYYYTGDYIRPFDIYKFPVWQSKGVDAHSVFADPLFVDPAHDDFRLKPASPASKVGFEPFDYSLAGVYGSSDWLATVRKEAVPTLPIPPALPRYDQRDLMIMKSRY